MNGRAATGNLFLFAHAARGGPREIRIAKDEGDRTGDTTYPSLNESLGDYWHREC